MFTNLTPFIPLSFKGEGEEIYREGFHPSLTYTPPSLSKGRGPGGWVAKQSQRLTKLLLQCYHFNFAPVAQRIEHWPPKPGARVQVPSGARKVNNTSG